jgi:hypothetical protein
MLNWRTGSGFPRRTRHRPDTVPDTGRLRDDDNTQRSTALPYHGQDFTDVASRDTKIVDGATCTEKVMHMRRKIGNVPRLAVGQNAPYRQCLSCFSRVSGQ